MIVFHTILVMAQKRVLRTNGRGALVEGEEQRDSPAARRQLQLSHRRS
eukprot:COSAG06_NODE_59216_length_275_cov_0.454545_1_plen_47_part_10